MNWLIYLMLVIAFFMVAATSIKGMVRLLAIQSLTLALLGVLMGYFTGFREFYIAAILTFTMKGLLIPYILLFTINRVNVSQEIEPFIGLKKSLLICLCLVFLAFEILPPDILAKEGFTNSTIPIAVSLALIGLFLMIARKKALVQIIGLLVMENGLYLLGMSATYGMPFLVEMGVFLDLVVGALLMGVLTFRISKNFDSIDTNELNRLKG